MTSLKKWLFPSVVVALVPGPAYAAQYLTQAQAEKILFPEAKRFQENHVIFSADQIKLIEKKIDAKLQTKGQQIWKAYDEERFLGFLILDYVIGKHETIDYVVALEPDGKVKGVEILSYRESYGGEIKSEHWRAQFIGKSPKTPPVFNGNISNIGGATLSCRHVTEGINKILVIYESILTL